MTLTTERQQFEQWWETTMHNGYPPRFGWEHWRDGDGYRDDDGEFQWLWQAWQASRELLANREAQPVHAGKFAGWGLYHAGRDDFGSWLKHRPEDESSDAIAKHGYVSVKLFTAPPSPAVPNERHAFESFVAQQFGEAVDRRRAKNGDNEYMAWDMAVAWIVWQRRAAMLAQPVSQGYTLNSPEIPDGWKMVPNEPTTKQWAAGRKAMDGGIDKVTLAYRAMVEVAPPPGGSDDSHTTAT